MSSNQAHNTPFPCRRGNFAWLVDGMFQAPIRFFAALFLSVGLIASLAAWGLGGSDALLCCLLAASVCGGGGAAALFVERALQGPAYLALKVLTSFFLRTGFPLMAVVIVHLAARWLMSAGFAFYIIGFYFLSLALGTWLSINASRHRQ